MVMRIRLGRNRKLSHNYNSEGWSIELDVEVDQSLLAHPEQLRDVLDAVTDAADQHLDRREQLFEAAMGHDAQTPEVGPGPAKLERAPVVREAGQAADAPAAARSRPARVPPPHGTGAQPVNGQRHTPASQPQVNKIHAVCRKLDEDVEAIIHQRYGCDEVEELTKQQASELITWLEDNESKQSGARR